MSVSGWADTKHAVDGIFLGEQFDGLDVGCRQVEHVVMVFLHDIVYIYLCKRDDANAVYKGGIETKHGQLGGNSRSTFQSRVALRYATQGFNAHNIFPLHLGLFAHLLHFGQLDIACPGVHLLRLRLRDEATEVGRRRRQLIVRQRHLGEGQ